MSLLSFFPSLLKAFAKVILSRVAQIWFLHCLLSTLGANFSGQQITLSFPAFPPRRAFHLLSYREALVLHLDCRYHNVKSWSGKRLRNAKDTVSRMRLSSYFETADAEYALSNLHWYYPRGHIHNHFLIKIWRWQIVSGSLTNSYVVCTTCRSAKQNCHLVYWFSLLLSNFDEARPKWLFSCPLVHLIWVNCFTKLA